MMFAFFDWIIKKQLGLSLRFCLRITSDIYKELKLQHYFLDFNIYIKPWLFRSAELRGVISCSFDFFAQKW